MTLGLDIKELQKIFEDEYIATSQRRQAEQQNFAIDLISQGIPEIEAKKQAMYQIRQEATVQALLLTIQANNARLEYQLKNK